MRRHCLPGLVGWISVVLLWTALSVGPARAVDSLLGPVPETDSGSANRYRDAVLADNPVGYWRLQEASGTTASDTSTSGIDGTYLGGFTLDQAGPFGFGHKAVSFNGTSGYVNVVDSGVHPLDLTGGVTMEAWFNWNGDTGENIIWNKENVYEGAVKNTSRLQAAIRPNWAWNNNAPVDPDEWTHVAITWDEDRQIIYVDGVEADNVDLPDGPINVNNNEDFRIASRSLSGGTSFFGGLLSEVAIFDSALTQSQIQAHLDALTPIPPEIPEPSSIALFGVVLALWGGYSYRRRRTSLAT